MRTRNDLERLEAAGRPLLAEAESLVDTGEEDRILARILASDRPPARPRATRRLRPALLLAAAAVVAAAIAVVSSDVFTRSNPAAATQTGGPHRVALSGAAFQVAGYRFRSPAGFKASSSSCPGASSGSGPQTVLNGFAAAASADGGCVEAAYLIPGSPSAPDPTPADAQAVDVGSYQGYFVSQGSAGDTLYVELPAGPAPHPYLVLFAEGLTEDQLIAVAQSGLPQNP